MTITRERTRSSFDVLEPRQYMANPGIVDFSVSAGVVHAGDVITLTAHATDDTGVRAVVFWIEDGQDGLQQFILNSYDQPLGDIFTPDAGTTDRYSVQVRVGASWRPTVKFGVDVVDVDGNYSQSPIHFVTVQNRNKPFVQEFRAETIAGGDIHLRALTSSDGEHLGEAGIVGVTFFLDQNGNNQWDSGTDVDLGRGTPMVGGGFELTVTPQSGWNLTWFTASAFDNGASIDRFGPNHSTVLRGDDVNVPWIQQLDIIPPDNDLNSQMWQSNETARFLVGYAGYLFVRSVTIFHDRNQNGLWDVGIDTPLLQYYPPSVMSTWYFEPQQRLGDLGHGWQSLGFAVHDYSGRGDDSWGPVTTLWINIDNTPWVESGSVSPYPVPQGTAFIDFTFRVRDDDGVQGVVGAFVDLDGDRGFAEAGEPLGTNLTLLTPGRTDALWRLRFDTHALTPGTYGINIWLQDYRDLRGPRSVISFTVV